MKKTIKKVLVKAIRAALKDPEIQQDLWYAINRPNVAKMGILKPHDPWLGTYNVAAADTSAYIITNMLTTPIYDNRLRLFDAALTKVKIKGSYLEFGCGHEAKSINYLADQIDTTIHGFDSFEGLPDAWFGTLGIGSLNSGGQLPDVRDNVKLHQGWFDDSVPAFAAMHPEPVAFMHIDCDLYSSTQTIFEVLSPQIGTGTVIQFDEYFNYPGWREHEFKAFQEFVKKRSLSYEYLGYSREFSVAVRIT